MPHSATFRGGKHRDIRKRGRISPMLKWWDLNGRRICRSVSFKDKLWQLKFLDHNHRLLRYFTALPAISTTPHQTPAIGSIIKGPLRVSCVGVKINAGAGTFIYSTFPAHNVDLFIYWLCKYTRAMFRQRMDTTPQWDTVKSRVMVEAQNRVPLHCSKEIKDLASGLRPMVAASLFLVWSYSCRSGQCKRSAGRLHRAGHTTGHGE